MKNNDDQIRQALKALFTLPAQNQTGSEREVIAVYMLAVEGIQAGFVAKACQRFIQGLVERPNLQFRPQPPELAVECRRLRDRAADLDRFDALRLPKPPEPDEPEATLEQRKRAVEEWQRIRAEFVETQVRKSTWVSPSREELIASRDRIAAQTGSVWDSPPVDISDFPEGR